MAISILGENISLVRPGKIPRPIVSKRGSATRASRPKAIKLTLSQKILIAQQMGFNLVCEAHMPQEDC